MPNLHSPDPGEPAQFHWRMRVARRRRPSAVAIMNAVPVTLTIGESRAESAHSATARCCNCRTEAVEFNALRPLLPPRLGTANEQVVEQLRQRAVVHLRPWTSPTIPSNS